MYYRSEDFFAASLMHLSALKRSSFTLSENCNKFWSLCAAVNNVEAVPNFNLQTFNFGHYSIQWNGGHAFSLNDKV